MADESENKNAASKRTSERRTRSFINISIFASFRNASQANKIKYSTCASRTIYFRICILYRILHFVMHRGAYENSLLAFCSDWAVQLKTIVDYFMYGTYNLFIVIFIYNKCSMSVNKIWIFIVKQIWAIWHNKLWTNALSMVCIRTFTCIFRSVLFSLN